MVLRLKIALHVKSTEMQLPWHIWVVMRNKSILTTQRAFDFIVCASIPIFLESREYTLVTIQMNTQGTMQGTRRNIRLTRTEPLHASQILARLQAQHNAFNLLDTMHYAPLRHAIGSQMGNGANLLIQTVSAIDTLVTGSGLPPQQALDLIKCVVFRLLLTLEVFAASANAVGDHLQRSSHGSKRPS